MPPSSSLLALSPQLDVPSCQTCSTPGPFCSQGPSCIRDWGGFVSCLLNRSLRKGGSQGFKGSFCVWHGAALREGTAGSTGHVLMWRTASPHAFPPAHLPGWGAHRYRGSFLLRVRSTQRKPALRRGLLRGQLPQERWEP